MKLSKHLYTTFVKPFIRQKLKRKTVYRHNKLHFTVFPGVFHPKYFFSSKFLVSFLLTKNLKGIKLCDACSGSGFVGLQAYAAGAEVLCFDIDPLALENIQYNYAYNFGRSVNKKLFNAMLSNGFNDIPAQQFDIITINPPYFFSEVHSAADLAWNCGKQGEFFIDFFSSLPTFLTKKGICYMVLADNCDIEQIRSIAENYNLSFQLCYSKKIMWEKNFIFEIRVNSGPNAADSSD